MTVELIAPKGRFRVVRIGWASCVHLVDDFDTKRGALVVAKDHNSSRARETDDAYFVYNDKGRCIYIAEGFSPESGS